MNYANMGKIIRVNLSDGVVQIEDLRQDWAKNFLGGAGLATRYLYQETPPWVDPLSPENGLIFMTGLLTGTASASASRYSVVAKSPLTGIWGQSNSGGNFGPVLKKSGFDGIIFEGASSNPVYLELIDGQARLRDASHLWGLNVPATEEAIQAQYKVKVTIASIGPGGENLVRYAAIMNDRHRAAGRCGLGAVMGAKRIKAIACAGSQPIRIANPTAFAETARRQIELMDESMLKVGFDTFGTNMVSDMVNVRGGYPVRNWQEGVFEQIDEVNAQALMDKVFVEEVRCFACPVACGRGTEIRDGKWAGQRGEGPEYESTNTLGALCGVADMNAITVANYRCNELGLDTISAGASIAFAIECYQRGLLSKQQTGGLELRYGDGELVIELVEKIARREGMGDLLAMGTRRMAEILGQDSQRFAMQVKGLELPAYDPRAAKITGLGYVTANRGGDHMTGYIQGPSFIDIPFLIVEESMIRDPLVANPQEVRVLVDMENALTALDAIGGCKFMGVLLTAEDVVGLISHATGWDFTASDFRESGERIYNLARAYCVRAGVRREDDRLPDRLMRDPLPSGPAAGMVIEPEIIEMMKDAYYQTRGWDLTTGIPLPEKLRQLRLEEIIPDLWASP